MNQLKNEALIEEQSLSNENEMMQLPDQYGLQDTFSQDQYGFQ